MNDRVYVDTIERGDKYYTVGGAYVKSDGPSKMFKVDIDEDVMEYICEEVVLYLDDTGYTDSIVDTVLHAVMMRLKEGNTLDKIYEEFKLRGTPIPLLTQEQYKERMASENVLPEDL